ncbi:putative cell wall glycosyl hydrolase Dfg5 [Choiromyces venosus 120613-1]|uniref:Mannan endo-1,6-alpha-mannosidase n=1 Tax=Choiromyces venosus 120613-1 TaxID=1336337 RepID=A0A3N4JUP6_9PEZI|nr:putative cell wall glycosyl hydrolase Dfg5 [Choiromyces venosus 120613-1]
MKFFSSPSRLLASSLLFATLGSSIVIDLNTSIKSAAKIVAENLHALYPANETWFVPGEFGLIQTADGKNDKGYYWWEAGAAMGAWIEYWHYTGDSQFNDIVTEAMLHQVGENQNYEPQAHTLSLGNDDQAFWGIAAMAAAERAFPNPPADKPQWLALAQAVFNRQAGRWDSQHCNGGLRWQVVSTNKGYDYKNAISNGLFFHLGARLARYTGNQSYAELAERTYDWSRQLGLIGDDYKIYDGAHIPECSISSVYQWTYNAGVFLSGAAYMYNFTNGTNQKWKNEIQKLMDATTEPFFSKEPPNIMQESTCEFGYTGSDPTCNTDQRSFKAYFARFLGYTYQMAPFTADFIMPRLKATAAAAAASCTGGSSGTICGLSWIKSTYDGSPYGIAKGGVGEQMAVMEVIQNNLVPKSKAPVTANNGGTSVGNSAAGGSGADPNSLLQTDPSTTGDKAGAGFLTAAVLGLMLSLTYWLVKS